MAKMKKTWGESARRAGEATASAIRKLFGGQPSTSGSNSDSGRSSSHDQRSIHDGNKDCEIANPSSNFVQKAETPSSKLPEPSASTSNSSKEPNTPTAHIDGNMPAVQSSSRHSGSANASVAKENNAGSHDGQHTSPPLGEDSKADGLASSMNGLSLGQTAESSVPEAGHTGENGSAAQAPQEEELTEEEKAFRAERAKHLVFIEEALDMVSFPC